MLFAGHLGGTGEPSSLELVRRHFPDLDDPDAETRQTKEDHRYTEHLVAGILEHIEELDEVIEEASSEWRTARMAAIDLNILRMGAYELLYEQGVPVAVVMDEAVSLAGRYGQDRSAAFVNGVLDRVKTLISQQNDEPSAAPVDGLEHS
ncbi:MAG: transcription antitermination factor NusB [Deltaproteobacteria bacterium]|nr:transcription antitermination factor NusB [Deltaproteobacteria bacterium]